MTVEAVSGSYLRVGKACVRVLLQIGSWIKACLEGRRCGLSGRVLDPVGVFGDFRALVPEVKPYGHPGDSIFVGLPCLDDARVVAAAAGVQWPQ